MRCIFILFLSILFIPEGYAQLETVPGDTVQAGTVKDRSALQPLRGYQVRRRSIAISVPSRGCTTKKDFKFELLESDPIQVAVYRLRPDSCKGYAPNGVWLRYTFDEVGLENGARFTIINPSATFIAK